MIDISASLTDAEVASLTFKHSARLVNHSHIVRIGLGIGLGALALAAICAAVMLRKRNKELEYQLVNIQNPSVPTGKPQVVPQ